MGCHVTKTQPGAGRKKTKEGKKFNCTLRLWALVPTGAISELIQGLLCNYRRVKSRDSGGLAVGKLSKVMSRNKRKMHIYH